MDTIDGQLALTIDAAKRALGCGRSTVYRLIGDGTLEVAKVYGRTVVTARSIRRLLELDRPFSTVPQNNIRPRRRSRDRLRVDDCHRVSRDPH